MQFVVEMDHARSVAIVTDAHGRKEEIPLQALAARGAPVAVPAYAAAPSQKLTSFP